MEYYAVKNVWDEPEKGMFKCKLCGRIRLNSLRSKSRKGMCILCIGESGDDELLESSVNVFKEVNQEGKI